MPYLRSNLVFPIGHVAEFDSWVHQPFATFPWMGPWLNEVLPSPQRGRPSTDVFEDATHYHVRLELPGLKREDLKVEVLDRLLQVSATRREPSGDPSPSFTLMRSLLLPDSVSAGGIAAKLEDGLLQITLPKQEHRKLRSIEVQ